MPGDETGDVRKLVEEIARNLVDAPDEVKVSAVNENGTTVLELRVAQADMGRVIGRQGRIAQAMRVLLRVAGQREGRRTILEIG